jgi:hypothetical protein
MHSSGSRITVPTVGTYLVGIEVRATDGLVWIDLYLNGTMIHRINAVGGTGGLVALGSIQVACAAGDYLELAANNSASSSSYETVLLGESPKFSATLIAA